MNIPSKDLYSIGKVFCRIEYNIYEKKNERNHGEVIDLVSTLVCVDKYSFLVYSEKKCSFSSFSFHRQWRCRKFSILFRLSHYC